MLNQRIASMLYQIADLLELKEEKFKPQAYRRAARSIEAMDKDIQHEYEQGRLREIPGVGEAIEGKIIEIIRTGDLRYLSDLKAEFPAGLVQVMNVPEIGPKTAVRLYKEIKITNLADLRLAAEQHRIRELKGFGERTEENILKGIRYLEQTRGRMLLGYAHPIAEGIVNFLREKGGFELVTYAGSLRRMRETIGDIDILVGSDEADLVTKAFISYPEVEDVLASGPTKSSVILSSGAQVDLRVVPAPSYGAALQYFTGSKEHNVALRTLAIEKGFKLNEYGLFRRDDDSLVAARTEEEIYRALGMEAMPPETRENEGEIELSLRGGMPRLVQIADIKGDLHVHTNASDGADSMEAMAMAAKARGYEYVGITDHSVSLTIANGLDETRLRKNIAEARRLSEVHSPFRVFIGAEVEVGENGQLDYPSGLLSELDLVVAGVHSRFKMGQAAMTDRLLNVLSDENVDVLAHPTGRILGQREGYPFDVDRVFQAAKDNDVAMEINSFPDRLDLGDRMSRSARDRGASFSIATDSHSIVHLDFMKFGVATARRGWLEAKHVLNSRGVKDMERWLGL